MVRTELADKLVPREGVPVCPQGRELFLESGIKCPLLPPSHPAAQEMEAPGQCLVVEDGEDGSQEPLSPGVPGSVSRVTLPVSLHLRPHLTPVS